MATINDLPIIIWPIIFKNLSIKDKLNCRLVNRKFYHSIFVHKLVINQLPNDKSDLNYYWYFNKNLINEDDTISFDCFKRMILIFNLDLNLKYLRINLDKIELKQELLILNNFINLEYLEIYSQIDHSSTNKINIKLNLNLNLKNLKYFTSYTQNSIYFIFDTPKLEKIQFRSIENICIKNLESIRHLITIKYDVRLEMFKNVKIIEFTNPIESNFNVNLLSIFNNLEQLKISIGGRKNLFNQLEDCLIKILNNRMKLNRKIDIYFEGVKIINKQQLNEIKLCDNILKYQFKNYDLLDSDLGNIFKINYSELNELKNDLKKDLPSSFFNKFQNISDVHISNSDKSIDINNLNWFLINLNCLRQLRIQDILLDQNFFNNLPNTIRYLYIRDFSNQSIYSNIDFNFILKLTRLTEFSVFVEKNLFNLALKSFLNLKYLKKFEFLFKAESIGIYKETGKFKLNPLKFNEELDYDQLIERCKTRFKYCQLYESYDVINKL